MNHGKNITRIQISQMHGRAAQDLLQDQYLFFDNMDEGLKTNWQKTTEPILTDDLISIHIVRGTLVMEINRENVVLMERHIISIMPGSVFRLIENSPDLVYFGFAAHIDRIMQMLKSLHIETSLSERSQCFYKRRGNMQAVADNIKIFKLIKAELALPPYWAQSFVIQRYCEILTLKDYELYRESVSESAAAPAGNTRRDEIFRLFLRLLEENYLTEKSTAFYASKLCMTPKYLSSVIKEQSGKSCSAWIDEYISLNARSLLKESTLSIKQISYRLGFPSLSVFGRFFKRVNGITPKAFRNREEI